MLDSVLTFESKNRLAVLLFVGVGWFVVFVSRFGFLVFVESLILAQDERWRRA